MPISGDWTYTGNPETNDTDRVRFLLQDTDETDKQLSDLEITFLLQLSGSPTAAAIRGAKILETKYARLANSKRIGDLSIDYGDRAARFAQIAKDLAAITSEEGLPVPSAGGLTRSGKSSVYADRDRNAGRIYPGITAVPGGAFDDQHWQDYPGAPR